MKCILSSARYGSLSKKEAADYGICDYIKYGKVQEYWWSTPKEERKTYDACYIEGSVKSVFEKLRKISDITNCDRFVLTVRDDGDIEATIYDDYIE